MAKYACIDVGGTFTDAAILDENGALNVFKSPTTPHDWTEGILGALKVAAEFYNQSVSDFLKDISVSSGGFATHGSTIATNAIVERKVGKIGIICTKGFRDVFLFREGPNKNPFDFDLDYPEPFVPRYLTLSVEERINSEGEIDTPLNEEEVRAVTKQLKEYNVEAICICFLWSTANQVHEKRAEEIIHKEWPEVQVVLSCEVNPNSREYRRWISAAMDASLRKLVSIYANNLNNRLNDSGFIGEIGMLNSSGGVMSTKEIVGRPIFSVDSGPSMAPVSGREYALRDLGDKNAVVLDMGGTTFDVSCVIGGNISVSRETVIGDEIPGISRVNVHSIGAGGGSIAWVDSGGMVRVGPRSAGSVPGPACYNRGGTQPTVTDANLVLGYINAEFFNNGKMKLYPELAYKAIKEHVADKLGVSVMDAAYTIWTTVNVNMIAAIKDITIWQGIDPRNYVMVAGGGACGLHAIPLAEGLDMKKLLIPRTAGGLSAVGGIFSDVVSEYNDSFYTTTRDFDFDRANKVLESLYQKAVQFFERNKIKSQNRKIELYMEGHYPFQVWELSVNITEFLTNDFKIDEDSVKSIEMAFHEEHKRTFTIKEDTFVECIYWRIKAIGKTETEAVIPEQEYHKENVVNLPDKRTGSRKIYFKKYNEMIVTPIYAGENLVYGDVIEGPAIIEEPTTTVVVLPGYEAKVTKFNNYYIEAGK
ncbi:hydantoinase/oxoprolinase family protein [Acetivibrio cellulolyticus]|uniref:hydantoinase/oxoprolinase family protein n=1 Tax=Acetivibrio cellulolyticus TaxID=35830 RepID=UPI0001E2E6FF|nr:hydantoinase/oxoprolinase family protein [Acetivibrio cellulolyticus]